MWVRWALAGLVLLCAGCELRLEVDAVFDRDAGGRLVVALSADADLQARAEAAASDPLDDVAAAGQELAARGWRVEDTTDDQGRRTVALSAGFDGPEAFNLLSAEVAQALAAPEVDLLEPLTATVQGERLVVTGGASMQPTAAVSEFGLSPEEVVDLLREQGGFSYVVGVALPGEVLESTATGQDGQRLTWTVDPGEQVAIHAVGLRPGPPVWPLVAGAIVGLLFAGLVLRRLVVVRRRSRVTG